MPPLSSLPVEPYLKLSSSPAYSTGTLRNSLDQATAPSTPPTASTPAAIRIQRRCARKRSHQRGLVTRTLPRSASSPPRAAIAPNWPLLPFIPPLLVSHRLSPMHTSTYSEAMYTAVNHASRRVPALRRKISQCRTCHAVGHC